MAGAVGVLNGITDEKWKYLKKAFGGPRWFGDQSTGLYWVEGEGIARDPD